MFFPPLPSIFRYIGRTNTFCKILNSFFFLSFCLPLVPAIHWHDRPNAVWMARRFFCEATAKASLVRSLVLEYRRWGNNKKAKICVESEWESERASRGCVYVGSYVKSECKIIDPVRPWWMTMTVLMYAAMWQPRHSLNENPKWRRDFRLSPSRPHQLFPSEH